MGSYVARAGAETRVERVYGPVSITADTIYSPCFSNEVSETILYFIYFSFSSVKLKRMRDLCLVYDF